MTTCLIIEDDCYARDQLSTLIRNNFSQHFNVIGIASTLKDGISKIKAKSPELIFINIELPDENGLNIFNYFPEPKFDVIFISLSQDYALAAIKHMAVDYLIKPFNPLDLNAAIVRFQKRNISESQIERVKFSATKKEMGISFSDKIALPTSDGFQVIPYNEILYCQASENYTNIYTINGESLLITKSLKTFEEILPPLIFFRIHKSILLNINYIKSFSRKNGLIITLETGHKFEVATRRYDAFINHIFKKSPVYETMISDFNIVNGSK